jgi:hypothetical protein
VDEKGRLVGGSGSSVHTYDFKDAAKYLAGEVRKHERQRIYVGVFYDPMVYANWKSLSAEDRKDPKTAWKKLTQKGKVQSEALLRQQAKDFVAWLKKQGALIGSDEQDR